jgi:hypothetical protein
MDKQTDPNLGKFVHRHLSQLKVLTRLMEHELDQSKGGKDVAIDRELAESMLDTLEIFIEDCEGEQTGTVREKSRVNSDAKPSVTRLN